MFSKSEWHEIGQALYGHAFGWQKDLAASLGISYRSLKNYIAGRAFPDANRAKVESGLRRVLNQRLEQIQALLVKLKPKEETNENR